jgi:GT2 family glycosyltransferase
MASLICIAVHDTEENGRTKYTEETFKSLLKTVDFRKHRLIIGDNASCDKTRELYGAMHCAMVDKFGQDVGWNVFHNKENIGTAEAINQCIRSRSEQQFVIKMDNDVVIRGGSWVEQMEEAITRMPEIGILGLKRKDLWEHPAHENLDFRSRLIMAPHKTGQRWIVVEQAPHIIGTCQMFNPALLDKIGYLKQPGVYGFDDTLASLRSQIAGFKNCFLPHIDIEHIDVGGDDYCKWKQREADRSGNEFAELRRKYQSGEIPVYYNPFETL